MLIVSQDKGSTIIYENMEVVGVGNPLENAKGMFAVIASAISDNQYILGEYKTEERAKEVLQEIKYKYAEYMQLDSSTKGTIGFYAPPKVYEMPKE